MKTQRDKVSNARERDMTIKCVGFTSYVEIGWRGVTGPSAVHCNTFIFPLVRLLAVLNLQSSCIED